ncbi:tRNA (adenosine(37)-N6)-dimethylallyltransferase MiaA [Candidatus Microgenomates bacterium]|nr:tRNA (adenosine(37)-N6)-dimethylallyltransferase MiaA [Candidatus Microgenomates bacterium]
MKKLLIICGPTATGKTQVGVKLAQQFNGEIVSADSRQVYRGMDIATGKDLPVNFKFQISNFKFRNRRIGCYFWNNIPVWLLDVVSPRENFSVAGYHELAHQVITGIWQKDKLPILVGGTGLYIKAVTSGIDTLGVPPNRELRQAYENKSTVELLDILFHLDPEVVGRLNSSDRKNKVRLLRKIEIAQSDLPKKINSEWDNLDVIMIGLMAKPEILKVRINSRVDQWIKEGLEKEVIKLLANGVRWEDQAMSALGYREWRPYFEKKMSREAVIAKIKNGEWQYARRQMTWFKREKEIVWFDISESNVEQRMVEKVEKWYNNTI